MYKVLLVDDEKIILDGISSIIDWNAAGTELAGTASNGLEAYEAIGRLHPDIVISDIRMPGMDGLALVEKTKTLYPSTEFILLSGFSEFEFAKTAMQFGVKHYILKPCNEEAIERALGETVAELNSRKEREAFVRQLQSELVKVLPSAKEQFLKELVTNKMYGNREWEQYRSLFGISYEDRTVRLLLCQLEGAFEFEHLFAAKNIAEDILTRDLLILSTTIGNHVLLLIKEELDEESLLERLKLTKETFYGYYRLDMTIAVGHPGDITKARLIYTDTLRCLNGDFVERAAYRICESNFEAQKNKHSGIIAKAIDIIETHIGNPNLSLQWVAGEMLYMNADYLGKLFRKETGEKFSNYVMKLRIEKAKERILQTDDVKVFELAELVGFGDNPQYFSQVFKKNTGVTPSEYKRSP
jgi:two-component system response regulator YesN